MKFGQIDLLATYASTILQKVRADMDWLECRVEQWSVTQLFLLVTFKMKQITLQHDYIIWADEKHPVCVHMCTSATNASQSFQIFRQY